MKQLFAGLGVLVLCALSANAQDSLRTRYGLLGGLSFNMHNADFTALRGVPNCCSQFSSGSGMGVIGGAFVEFPLTAAMLFGARISFVDHSAILRKQEPYRIIVAGVGQDMVDEHTMDAGLSSIGIEPSISSRVFGNFFVSGGLRVGLMLAKSYAQKEQIIEPAGTGTFLDSLGNDSHSRIRNAFSGALPDAAPVLAQFFVGLRYELPVNAEHTVMLAPEVSYAYSLTNAVTGLEWRPNGVRAAIGFVYSPHSINRTYTYDTVTLRDTVIRVVRGLTMARITQLPSDKTDDNTVVGANVNLRTTILEHYLVEQPDVHDIHAGVQAFGVDDDGVEHPMATLRVEEFFSTRVHPLLAFIFFSEGDSVIPSRYHSLDPTSAKAFRLEHLFGNQPLEIYHSVLNIIGYRLQQYPDAMLTLTGCNSNQAVEAGNRALSQARAEAVKNYLTDVWHIPSTRITTSARDLPEKPSNPRTPDGQAENRRVEIACTNPEVLDVFVANDTIRTPVPPQIRLKAGVVASSGIGDWNVSISQGANELKHYQGTGTIPLQLDWDLTNEPATLPRFSEPLHVVVAATNRKGDRAVDSLVLPTEVVTLEQKRARKSGDVVVDRYNLVLFNFGTSDITPAHERIVKMVKDKLQPASAILVEGYTDRTGSNASNKTLSTNRAQSTARALDRQDIVVRGIGEERLLYPNDTPEGRFFCRTVQITVKTPVK